MRIAWKIVAAGLLGMAEGHADGIEPALPHHPNANLVLGQVFVDFCVFDRLHFEADQSRRPFEKVFTLHSLASLFPRSEKCYLRLLIDVKN